MEEQRPSIIIEELSDPQALADARQRRAQFDRNYRWLQVHAAEVYAQHRGKSICIAGEELFVAERPEDAMAQARATHPDDAGWFVHYIPKDKVPRIYAH
jgi:hypothetical protein